MAKPRIALDLPEVDDFAPKAARPTESPELARSAGRDAGFVTRHAPEPAGPAAPPVAAMFDARSLRRSNRTAQLGIALRPETRDRFWRVARNLGLRGGEETLEALLDAFDGKGRPDPR